MAEATDLPSNGSDPRTIGPVYEKLPLLRTDSGAVDLRRAAVDASCWSRRRLAILVGGAVSFLCLSILVITFAGSDVWGVANLDRRKNVGVSSESGTKEASSMTPAFLSSEPASGLRDLLHGEETSKGGKGHDKKPKKGKTKGHHRGQKLHAKGHGKKAAKAAAKAKEQTKAARAAAAAKAKEEYDEAAEAATRAKKEADAAKEAMEAKEKSEAAKAAAEATEKSEAPKPAADATDKVEAAKAAGRLKAAEQATTALHQASAAGDTGNAMAGSENGIHQRLTEDPFTNASTTETIVTSTVTTTSLGPFECKSDLEFPLLLQPDRKGMALDDTTMSGCPGLINVKWPNTQTNITSIRLFKAWDKGWDTNLSRHHIWAKLREFTYRNNAKILYGTMISCDEKQDDEDWEMVKDLMKFIGRDHVMGLSIGNEIELLHFKKDTPKDCAVRIWRDGYFMRKVMSRSKDLGAMPGFEGIYLTTAMGGYVLTPLPKDNPGPFINIDEASVLTFLKQVIGAFGQRWVFTWNIYPYFDPNLVMDGNAEHTCNQALAAAVNFAPGSAGPLMLKVLRQRIQQLTGRGDDVMWVGETGWSSPRADTLTTNVGNNCGKPWNAIEVFQIYYQNFLEWDMIMFDKTTKGVDHAFFFSFRDSINFGDHEYFGLESDCNALKCKIQQE
eukprot:TRINITY_DN5888_c0_g1_i2.p1 TRINITY_DN5888_c0_g1~~TRINITY_DN5888_c0_g1_i2.p1  ORF type:complete len:687 (+),score=140.20 TRINITY_DN5888_c0_g1_i2:51-2063(+)